MKASSASLSLRQSITAGTSSREMTRFSAAGQRRYQREMLIDHAEAEMRARRAGLRSPTRGR